MTKSIKKYLVKFIGLRLNTLYGYAPNRAAKKALKIFVTPRKGRINPDKSVFLKQAEKTTCVVEGQAIQTYVWAGGEKKILLVHGWESNVTRWREIIACLQAENFTIIALDAPAHGDSEGKEFNVPRYSCAIHQLAEKYRPQFVIGHSIGGTTVLFHHYKNGFPGLEKMVLLAPPSEMLNIMANFQDLLGLKPGLMRVFEEHFQAKFGYSFADFSILRFSENFENKALFIHDKDDKIVDWNESAALVKQWDNAELMVTKGLGHGLKNAAVYSTIINYLNA